MAAAAAATTTTTLIYRAIPEQVKQLLNVS